MSSSLSHFDQEDYSLFLKMAYALPYLEKNPPKEGILRTWYTNIMSAGTDSCGASLYPGGWKNAVHHMGLGGSNMGTVLSWYRGEHNFFQSGQELYQQLRFEILPIFDTAGLRLGKATEDLNRELFHEKYRAVTVDTVLDAVREVCFEHNKALRVTPDDIVIMPDTGMYIIDYKTVERGKPAKIISDGYKAQLVQGMTIAELLGNHISGGIISYLDILNMEAVAVFMERDEMLSIRKEMDEARELFWTHLINAEMPPYRTPFKLLSTIIVEDEIQKEIQTLDLELAYWKQGKKIFEEKIDIIQTKLEELCVTFDAESLSKFNGVTIKEQLTPESLAKVTSLYPEEFRICQSENIAFAITPEQFFIKYRDRFSPETLKEILQIDTLYDAEAAVGICKEKNITAETFKTPSTRVKTTKEVKAVTEELKNIAGDALEVARNCVLEKQESLQSLFKESLEAKINAKKISKK